MADTLKPLCIELFAGLHGWGEGALAEGFDVVGFDLGDMGRELGVPRPDGIRLVLQDVLTLHGAQFRHAALIVASPPCQAFSYMAMPWSRAKQQAREYRNGTRDRAQLTALFDACFRIQQEASESAGHHIPMVVENVRGAQEWVGLARWHFGSFYLWGDIPALMPSPKHRTKSGGNFHQSGMVWNRGKQIGEGVKVPGMNWPDRSRPAQAFNDTAIANLKAEGTKQQGSGREWFAGDGKISRVSGSKSPARRAASARIARIPFPLAQWIARAWKPQE